MNLIRKSLIAALVLGGTAFGAATSVHAAQAGVSVGGVSVGVGGHGVSVGVGIGAAPRLAVRPPVYRPLPRPVIYAPRPIYYARPVAYTAAYPVVYPASFPAGYPVVYGPAVVRPPVWVGGPRHYWAHPRPYVRIGF